MPYSSLSLTVAISTVKSSLPFVLKYLYEIVEFTPGDFEFLVVSQFESKNSVNVNHKSIKVIHTTEKGLSKSRNLAIKSCTSKWIWFQDGDVHLLLDHLPALVKFLATNNDNLVLAKVASSENPREFFKDYSRYNVPPRFLVYRVSSIEMIAKRSFLTENEIFFDENLGLGTSLPSCEENLFFYDVVIRNRGSFGIFDHPICSHTTNIESRDINYEKRYMARGYLLAKMPRFSTLVVFSWWAIRKTKEGLSRYSRISLMLKGVSLLQKKASNE